MALISGSVAHKETQMVTESWLSTALGKRAKAQNLQAN